MRAQSAALREELSYWLDPARARGGRLPVDLPGGDNTLASVGTVTSDLSAEETRTLLQEVPRAYHTQINDVLLTALAQAFARWTGRWRLLVDLEGHGREALFDDLDLSRTVGWFTALFPVFLELDGAEPPGEALKSVKEQLRRLPNRGVGYGALRYLCRDAALAEPLKSQAPAEVGFNYMGQLDRAFAASPLWRRARESGGPNHSPRGGRSHVLEVTGWVADGRLQLLWVYSRNLHHALTVERLAGWYGEALRALDGPLPVARGGPLHPFGLSSRPARPATTGRIGRPLFPNGRKLADAQGQHRRHLPALAHAGRHALSQSVRPGVRVYEEQWSCTLHGEPDVPAFQRAWQRALGPFSNALPPVSAKPLSELFLGRDQQRGPSSVYPRRQTSSGILGWLAQASAGPLEG